MPALTPYIPPKDAAYAAWLANFAALIAAAPMTYGLTSGDAAAISAANTDFQNAYALVTSPSTKTKDTVQAKNIARVSSLNTARPYGVTISLNPGVTASNKVALGLNPRTSTPAPVTTPTTYPILTIPSAMALNLIVRYRDELTSPSVKSKPYGVTQMQLYASTSGTPITDPTLLAFQGVRTKSPTQLAFQSAQKGLVAYIAGRWQTRTGLVGPWSAIINFVVPG
jgi:hypothetical protein